VLYDIPWFLPIIFFIFSWLAFYLPSPFLLFLSFANSPPGVRMKTSKLSAKILERIETAQRALDSLQQLQNDNRHSHSPALSISSSLTDSLALSSTSSSSSTSLKSTSKSKQPAPPLSASRYQQLLEDLDIVEQSLQVRFSSFS
jgi:hypothetical protein